eukprot:Nitzschia sp. Nitz4//scaffold137_size62074//19710//20898//NITZ4_006412-RA/size62074-snap-gene-0.16-mRNA-1//1//CDS//3329535691//8647//frame0
MFRLATKTVPTWQRSVAASSFQRWNGAWLSTSAGNSGMYDKLTFIGAGKMAQAMIEPLIARGYQPADKVTVFDVSNAAMQHLAAKYPGVNTAVSMKEALSDADMIVCAVKPQNINQAFFDQFPKGDSLHPDATMISILAGTPVHAFHPSGLQKIVRAMPNTPATIGEGITVWCCTPNLTTHEREDVNKVLETFGKAIYVDDEKFVDMSTSISGSGPAYIFMLMEAMIDAGVHMGFSRNVATELVYHTLLGSTLYAMETGEHPAILRNQVTSPAGTTASAIYELENGKFRVVIKDAIWACYRRSLEIGGKESSVGPGRQHSEPREVIHYHYPSGEMDSEPTQTKK